MRALTKLKDRKDDFDLVLLETTGLADPAPIISTFTQNWAINNNFRIDGVISLVDAKNITTHINEVGGLSCCSGGAQGLACVAPAQAPKENAFRPRPHAQRVAPPCPTRPAVALTPCCPHPRRTA